MQMFRWSRRQSSLQEVSPGRGEAFNCGEYLLEMFGSNVNTLGIFGVKNILLLEKLLEKLLEVFRFELPNDSRSRPTDKRWANSQFTFRFISQSRAFECLHHRRHWNHYSKEPICYAAYRHKSQWKSLINHVVQHLLPTDSKSQASRLNHRIWEERDGDSPVGILQLTLVGIA